MLFFLYRDPGQHLLDGARNRGGVWPAPGRAGDLPPSLQRRASCGCRTKGEPGLSTASLPRVRCRALVRDHAQGAMATRGDLRTRTPPPARVSERPFRGPERGRGGFPGGALERRPHNAGDKTWRDDFSGRGRDAVPRAPTNDMDRWQGRDRDPQPRGERVGYGEGSIVMRDTAGLASLSRPCRRGERGFDFRPPPGSRSSTRHRGWRARGARWGGAPRRQGPGHGPLRGRNP